ncbi:23S rRNA (adenine(2030)-N(6))-methyltransferase RlmJ [Uliginosibacterium gangwonense]|uniref:23S rRNA (adenine(2030)-N(6))-methyltransferase RlmJ n=1 Tax=Uliginosibacterium gangwonense TaxID=392736 RepID=UPI00035D0C4D|nr:23S rRNA (adenine(2030)-N(6))-methyltransferase RlmJ [Uliginosibacterium gangwonense]
MLSYRHSFHAGNHADVLKHAILIQLLNYMGQKDKPFWVIDTHAGAGRYSLESVHASKLEEHVDGIARLWGHTDLPPILADYLEAIRAENPNGRLRFYPGSPCISQSLLREQDKLRLFELHSTDHQLLAENFSGADKNTIIYADDGFATLKALLPPPSRRGLVLIDPSYELREDYGKVIHTLREALLKFPTGTYAIWYPQLPKLESAQLPKRLKALGAESWLHVTLTVRKPTANFGMAGSGMFIINPPWTLHAALETAMPRLRDLLAQDEHASFTLEQLAK